MGRLVIGQAIAERGRELEWSIIWWNHRGSLAVPDAAFYVPADVPDEPAGTLVASAVGQGLESRMLDLLNNHDLILMEAAIVERVRRDGMVALDPILANAPLIYDEIGRRELERLYLEYVDVASNADLPLLLCTPTWRANEARVQVTGVDPNINADAVRFLKELRTAHESKANSIRIGGMIGCKNDCYRPSEGLTAIESEQFHRWQIRQLADSGADFLIAETLPFLDEAIGIAQAMALTDLPYIISFVINRLGTVLDGSPLTRAIETIDEASTRPPLGYMVNCAYPTFLIPAIESKDLSSRLIGIQGNASSADHADLDRAETLLAEDVGQWGDAMLALHTEFGLKILGGCCGTQSDHLRYIVDQSAHL